MKITKLLKPHRKNCSALSAVKDGEWKSPWFFKETYYYHRWHHVGRIICNSTNCKAEIRVDMKEIEAQFKDWGIDNGK